MSPYLLVKQRGSAHHERVQFALKKILPRVNISSEN
jgi:hypothetical protein